MGLSVSTIILPPFLSFSIVDKRQKMLIGRRRNSDPTAAGGNNDITAPRHFFWATELCSCYYLVRTVFFQAWWDVALEGGVLRRMVKKFSFDVLQGYRPVYFMGYRVQHLFPAFLPRIWYLDFFIWWLGGEERLQNITEKQMRRLLSLN